MGYCVSKFRKNVYLDQAWVIVLANLEKMFEAILLKNKQIYCRLVHERLIENNDLLWTYLDQAWVIVLANLAKILKYFCWKKSAAG